MNGEAIPWLLAALLYALYNILVNYVFFMLVVKFSKLYIKNFELK